MTDHIPNDLSHLSDAEFHSLCPQGEHAPGPEPLSPAAQAAVKAVDHYETTHWLTPREVAAAALRAVSEHGEFVILDDSGYGDFVVKVDFLRATAAELEGKP
jgi:hypothetical protein